MALDLNGYHLTFNDDFNSFSSTPQGSGGWQSTLYGARTLSNNGEQQYYSDSTVGVNPFSVANGELTITASPGSNPYGLWYNSGVISTLGDFSQQYGYFEMRAKLPEGSGMWPGFWLLQSDHSWPPELDVLEAFGATNSRGEGGPNQAHINMISTVPGQSQGNWVNVPGNIYNEFHDYGADWQPDHITYYIDGQQVGQINTPSDMHEPMYMVANLAVGGGWAESPGGETSHLTIDHIRAYSKDPSYVAVPQPDPSPSADSGASSGTGTNADPSVTPPADTTQQAGTTAGDQTASAPPGDGGTMTAPPENVAGAMLADGTASPQSGAALPPTSPATADASGTATLRVSGDAWNGNPEFLVYIDGKQVGGWHSATADHSAGEWQDIAIAEPVDGAAHTVWVKFLNDATGTLPTDDRNLYVQSLDMNGQRLDGNTAMNNAAQGHEGDDPNAAVMRVDGAVEFHVAQSGAGDLWHA